MGKKAVVIGSGFGGIAISLRLKKLGYDTTIIEKLDELGGRARVFEINGFKHDAGPTVITAPFLFDELFKLFGKNREDYLNFVPLEPWYRYHFHDGKTFDYCSTVEKTNREISKFDKKDIKGYYKLLNQSKKILEITYEKLVSIDFNHNSASAIIDSSLTSVIGKNMGKISAWYDNEWAFSNRMCDIAGYLHKIS